MKKTIFFSFMLILMNISFVYCDEIEKMKVELKTVRYPNPEPFILTAEMPIKKFKLIKAAKLCEGKFFAHNFYLEEPANTGTSEKDYVSKEEYEKNPSAYPEKDILVKVLPIGTEFEVVRVNFDARSLSHCNYWIRLINDPEYKDILIDAVALTDVENNYLNRYWWAKFEDDTSHKERIITEKVPFFEKKNKHHTIWAVEIKQK